jgi:hypothetical protein
MSVRTVHKSILDSTLERIYIGSAQIYMGKLAIVFNQETMTVSVISARGPPFKSGEKGLIYVQLRQYFLGVPIHASVPAQPAAQHVPTFDQ